MTGGHAKGACPRQPPCRCQESRATCPSIFTVAAFAQTLQQLGRERLGGELGATIVLHTWGQRLGLHPHLHAIVAGGALDSQGRWHPVKSRRFLLPVGVVAAVFRGKFLAGLTRLKERGAVPEPPGGWPKLWRALGEAKK